MEFKAGAYCKGPRHRFAYFKVSIGVNLSVNVTVCVCVSPVIVWRVVQALVSRLKSADGLVRK